MLSAGVYKGPMRRADRLFQIIQILRRARGPVTADAIAAELETSKRSVYRDVATLWANVSPSAAKPAWATSWKAASTCRP